MTRKIRYSDPMKIFIPTILILFLFPRGYGDETMREFAREARQAMLHGDWELAYYRIKQQIDLKPSTGLYLDMGRVQCKRGLFKSCRHYIHKYINESGSRIPHAAKALQLLSQTLKAKNNSGSKFSFSSKHGLASDTPLTLPPPAQKPVSGISSPQDFFERGKAYETGLQRAPDRYQAIYWYQKAAELGYPAAEYHLGSLYLELGKIGEAVPWIKKAAIQGWAQAQFHLGELLFKGKGISQNFSQAALWLEKASRRKHLEASFRLGDLYYNGVGVSKDYEAAAKFFRMAARADHVGAQFRLGHLYETGTGVKQSYGLAILWYRKAANKGDWYACANLGKMYEHGSGTAQNYTQALKWYLKSANQGDWFAASNLSRFYRLGLGVKRDAFQSMQWHLKSMELGNPNLAKPLKSGQFFQPQTRL
jgi:uncharacterized protein